MQCMPVCMKSCFYLNREFVQSRWVGPLACCRLAFLHSVLYILLAHPHCVRLNYLYCFYFEHLIFHTLFVSMRYVSTHLPQLMVWHFFTVVVLQYLTNVVFEKRKERVLLSTHMFIHVFIFSCVHHRSFDNVLKPPVVSTRLCVSGHVSVQRTHPDKPPNERDLCRQSHFT